MNYHRMGRIGIVRVVFEKRVVTDERAAEARSWDRERSLSEVEVLHHDTFETGFCGRHGPARYANELVCESGLRERVEEATKGLLPGFHELIAEVHYEYDPGYSSPNGPAEPDVHWWLEDARTQPMTAEQARWFYEDPAPRGLENLEVGVTPMEG